MVGRDFRDRAPVGRRQPCRSGRFRVRRHTLARIQERYGLYFYLPEGAKPGDESAIEVELTDVARQRYPGAEVRFRLSHLTPDGTHDSKDTRSDWVSLPPIFSGDLQLIGLRA